MTVLFILISLLVARFADGEIPAGFGCANTGYLTFGITRKFGISQIDGRFAETGTFSER